MHGILAGIFTEEIRSQKYFFVYENDYQGPPISHTMPTNKKNYSFDQFPPLFDGLLPEGAQLEALLKLEKLDHDDCFGQLIVLGSDLLGAITVEELHD